VALFAALAHYLSQSSAITWLVIGVLSLYFIGSVWIFIYRYRLLSRRLRFESDSLSRMYMGRAKGVPRQSVLYSYVARVDRLTPTILRAAIGDSVRISTRGLTFLSIASSTAPFIGLFGTVIGILETFSKLSARKSAALSVVAPAISEALIATAVGIFVAIFAYTFHLLLKRTAYELGSVLESQVEVILTHYEDEANVSLGR
jgi:biopolymer transport protein ExbB/TolQ